MSKKIEVDVADGRDFRERVVDLPDHSYDIELTNLGFEMFRAAVEHVGETQNPPPGPVVLVKMVIVETEVVIWVSFAKEIDALIPIPTPHWRINPKALN